MKSAREDVRSVSILMMENWKEAVLHQGLPTLFIGKYNINRYLLHDNKPFLVKDVKLGFSMVPFCLIPTVVLQSGHFHPLFYRMNSNNQIEDQRGLEFAQLPN